MAATVVEYARFVEVQQRRARLVDEFASTPPPAPGTRVIDVKPSADVVVKAAVVAVVDVR